MKKLPPKYRIIVTIAALLFALVLLFVTKPNLLPWAQHGTPRTSINITAVPVSTINKPIYIARTGSTQSSTTVPITAECSGTLSELYVKEGQAVKAGQPLLKIHATSGPAVNQTAGASPAAQASYDKALEEFNRCQKLFDIGAIPRRQMDIAATRLQEAKANMSSASNTTQSVNNTINGSTTINAPISGIVTGLSATGTIQTGQHLMSLGSGQELEVIVPLDQNDLYLVHLGTPAIIEVSQQAIGGQVSAIYPQVDAQQNLAFFAHIKLANNPAGILKANMSVNVRIDIGKSSAVAAVPAPAVFDDNQGQFFIYVAADGKAKIQPVLIGETIGDFIEITSMLPEQSLVITSNIAEIKDGDAITAMQVNE